MTNRNRLYIKLSTLALFLFAATVGAQDKGTNSTVNKTDLLNILKERDSSLVLAQLYLQYDNGDSPSGFANGSNGDSARRISAELVEENRPFELPGFLISPNKVVIPNIEIQDRFIKEIKVKYKNQSVSASVASWATDEQAVFLHLTQKLTQAEPLTFRPQAAKDDTALFAIGYYYEGAKWTAKISGWSPQTMLDSNGDAFLEASANHLIVTENGEPVTLWMSPSRAAGKKWKQSPMKWPTFGTKALTKKIAELESFTNRGLLHVKLHFRSPKKDDQSSRYSRGRSVVLIETIGIKVDKKRLLIPLELKPKKTARLKKIEVIAQDGKTTEALFESNLTDYSAMTALMNKPIGKTVKLADYKLQQNPNALLLAAHIQQAGDKRINRFYNVRVQSHHYGYNQKVYARLVGNHSDIYLFNIKNELLAFPLNVRSKPGSSFRRYSYSNNTTSSLATSAIIKELLSDLASNADPNNIPRTKETENEIAWMGILLQDLDQDLARENGATEETNDGQFGSLIIFVYPNSPADKAGIKPGMILLELHKDGEPKPIKIRISSPLHPTFPWERLGDVPEYYFDRIPTPWPDSDNAFNQLLTEIGIGKTYTAKFFQDGKIISKEFKNTRCPPHYKSARKFESEQLGFTVKDMTFEVRQYLRKEKTDPGVVISSIEKGHKASIAGLKPYEVITMVDGQKVNSVEQFEKLIQGQQVLNLQVLRMTRARQVRIERPEGQPIEIVKD